MLLILFLWDSHGLSLSLFFFFFFNCFMIQGHHQSSLLPVRHPGGTNTAPSTPVCKHPHRMSKDQAQGLSLSAVSLSHRSVISSAGLSAVNQTSGVPVMKQNENTFCCGIRAGQALRSDSSFWLKAHSSNGLSTQFRSIFSFADNA